MPSVNSCPFPDTSTVVLPATPATDTHSTTPAELLVDATTTRPCLHHACAPSDSPTATFSALPPFTIATTGDTFNTLAAPMYLNITPDELIVAASPPTPMATSTATDPRTP